MSSKRQKNNSGAAINVSVTKAPSGANTPVLALFPAAQPPRKTPFSLYTSSGAVPARGHPEPTVLAAETEAMEYESRNNLGVGMGGGEGESAGEATGHSVQYLLGVHDPTTNTLTLHSAPLHSLSPSVKSLKQLTAPAPAGSLMSVQRAALGAAFGTKKAIRALNAQARNKLDNESYGTGSLSTSLQSHLQSSITASASSLPTSAAIEHAANLSRPTIPPPNFDAKTPGEVYSINDIISSTELSTIDLTPFLKATNLKERNALIPFRRSKFIANHLRKLLPSRSTVEEPMPNPSKKDRERLQLVIHLSHLFAFRQFGGKDSNLEKSKMSEKLGEGVSPMLVDALLERYTEVQRVGNGQERRKVTGVMELKLLGYLLVVALRVDGWGTDVGILADDLGLGVKKVQELFRSLGCSIVAPSALDREKLVASGAVKNAAEARSSKQAVLKVPLEFPQERRGAPKR